jgi:hypothetical protein
MNNGTQGTQGFIQVHVSQKSIASSTSHLFDKFASHFPLTKDNIDILNYFIDFMICEMQWRTPLLGVTIELILHTLKLVFHWNVVLMSHVHCFL